MTSITQLCRFKNLTLSTCLVLEELLVPNVYPKGKRFSLSFIVEQQRKAPGANKGKLKEQRHLLVKPHNCQKGLVFT